MRKPTLRLRAFLLGFLPVWASAQEVVTLDKIEVTSQKRVQSIEEVPIPVTAYSGDFLERVGVTDLRSLATLVPGTFVQEQSPNNPGIGIRGITTDSGDPRSETRVSIFQDGISISRSRGSVVELFDLERVEVLKGPQGTLFGRGAQIGAISLIQNKPKNATEGLISLGYGNFDDRRLEAMYNTPLVENQLFGRVALAYREFDGTVDNLADGSDLNGKDTRALRTSLRWQPSDRTNVDVILNYQKDEPPGTAFKSGVLPTSRGETNPFSAAELNRGRGLYVDRTVWGLTGILDHEVSEAWSLTAITGYREFDAYEEFDADGSPLYLLELGEKAQAKQFSQEFRANFHTGGEFTGFVGAGYFYEDGEQRVPLRSDERVLWAFLSPLFRQGLVRNGVPAPVVSQLVPTLDPYNPPATFPATFAGFANPTFPASLQQLAGLANVPLQSYYTEAYTNYGETEAFDVFGDGTYRVTDAFEVTLGLRLTHEKITGGYQSVNGGAPGRVTFILPSAGGPNNAFRPTNGRLEISEDYTSWVARLVGRYQFSRELNAYASVARGRRPNSLSFSQTTLAPIELDEEIVWNYETGVKGFLPGLRAHYGVSGFYYTYSNFQSDTLVTPGVTLPTNAGSATGYGGEFTLQSQLSDTLAWFATYGYTDATFDDTDDDGRPQAYAGYSFRLTAKHTFSIGGSYTVPTEVGQVVFTPVYQYKSKHFFEDDNGAAGGSLRQDGYGVVNLRLGFTTKDGRYEVTAYADNVFDKEYLIDAGNVGTAFGIPTFIPGLPRMYGVKAAVRF